MEILIYVLIWTIIVVAILVMLLKKEVRDLNRRFNESTVDIVKVLDLMMEEIDVSKNKN